ncbi:MAG: peptidylprolyl isomerase [Candidatus Xenobia bacterium]
MSKRWQGWLVAALLGGALVLAGCGGNKAEDASTGGGDNSVVATVKSGNESGTITKQEWINAAEQLTGKQVLEQLEGQILVEQEAKRQGITISDKEYQDKLDEYHKSAPYKQALANGIDPKVLDANVKTTMLLKKLVLKDKITEQDMLRFYDRFKDQLTQLHVAHILVTDQKEAERIRAEAEKGADFAKLAKEDSKDPNSKDNGGDIGWVMAGQLMQEWGKAALDTPVGKIAPVVRSQYGYHVIKVLGKKSSYEDLKPEIQDQLFEQAEKPYLDLLRAKAQISDMYSKKEAAASPSASESK